jgi:LPS-assembly lipoprotein
MAPTLVTSCTALPPEGAAEPRGGPSVRRRSLIALAPAAVLAGCGFQLRRAPDFTLDALLLNAPAASPLAAELARALTASGKVQVLRTPAPASPTGGAATPPPPVRPGRVVFDLLKEEREKVVVGLNASGQVREFQLRLRVRFRVRNARGEEAVPETELVQHRDMSFNEQAVLAKEAEASLLYRDMQGDIVQQLMRRLAALHGT